MKKILSLIIVLSMLASVALTASAQQNTVTLEDVKACLDLDLAQEVTTFISEQGDNPDIGNRSSGSAAEKAVAAYLYDTLNSIGLQNVTTDEFTDDNWTFNRGRVYYKDINGEEQYVLLGGYATQLVADMQEVSIVYAGRGTAADYEGLDVNGKVVLIDINQSEDWWVEVPAYEAYTRGALCVLTYNDGHATYDADTLGSQDICGPDYAPAFSVSLNGSAALREVIDAAGGEATVVLDVESIVTKDGTSQNVWGEIPGATDEVIYFFAHYDGYYHSFFDDASGVGSVVAIAKALVDSGYIPDKTLRFVLHGSEEWGISNTEYDWSIGAWKEITEVHPEWAEKAFAILNIDGMYSVNGHISYSVKTAYELHDYASNSAASDVYSDGIYEFYVDTPTNCWTEDFGYLRFGVPSIVASYSNPHDNYRGTAYHSSMDNIVLGVDTVAWAKLLDLFTTYCFELDNLAARPVNFASRFEAMAEAYPGSADLGIDAVIEQANALTALINAVNNGELSIDAAALNARTTEVLDYVTDNFLAFDWEDNTVFPFEQTYCNIDALEASIELLEAGDAETVLDEYLYDVDYNWYAYDFSEESYNFLLDKMYLNAEGTWGEGLIWFPGENLWTVVHSLQEKAGAEDADFTNEIIDLQTSLEKQYSYASILDNLLTASCAETAEMIAQIIADFGM